MCADTHPDESGYCHIAIPVDVKADVNGLILERFNHGSQLDPGRNSLSTRLAQKRGELQWLHTLIIFDMT